MKAHSTQLLTIEELVNTVLLDITEDSHRKEQFLSWGVRYFKRWRMNMAREYKKVTLQMTPWKSVVLPNDCVDWIALGISNGESFDVFTNKKLNPRDCACDDSSPTQPVYCPEEGSEGIQFNNITEFGEDPGKMYGLMSKDNGLGYFEPNHIEGSNEIQLSANVKAGTPIKMIYLATLFNPDVDCCVHPYAQTMIETAMHWENLKMKRRSGNRNISPQDIRDAKEEYDNALCELAEMRFELSTATIMESVREGARQSPKQ